MLVLSRRQSETILIDDHITVTILSVMGNKVRVGVEAPDEVLILRGELKPEWEREKELAEV